MIQEDKRSYNITKKDNGWYRVEVIDKYGTWTEVYEVMKSKLETLPCWEKYKSYTASNNIPTVLRGKELI